MEQQNPARHARLGQGRRLVPDLSRALPQRRAAVRSRAPRTSAREHIPGWRICPWGMEWYGRDEWEQPHADNFWATVFHRRFGGDLVGLREQLPYLQELGINAIYLNPVFWARLAAQVRRHRLSPHRPHLRPRPRRRPARAGSRQRNRRSRHLDLDRRRPLLSGTRRRYPCPRHAHHPRRRLQPLRHPLLRVPGPEEKRPGTRNTPTGTGDEVERRRHLRSRRLGRTRPACPNSAATRTPSTPASSNTSSTPPAAGWIPPGRAGPAEGIDGWRLDVAFCVPHGFWKEWHAHVRSINPEAYTTGEIVGPAQDWIRPDEFSAVMNYEWAYPTIAFFTTNTASIGAAEFRDAHRRPPRAPRARHRAHPAEPARLARHRPHPDPVSKAPARPSPTGTTISTGPRSPTIPTLKTHRPGPEAKQALKLAAVWQITGPGAPMIYYGTEVGMWGANDPCDRQPMLWSDLSYEDETQGFRAPLPTPHSRAPDLDLFAFYQRLIAIRNSRAGPAARFLPLARSARRRHPRLPARAGRRDHLVRDPQREGRSRTRLVPGRPRPLDR